MSKPVQIIVPSLIGGISQQPAHLRHPNQVEDAQNALFDIAEGMTKRPGSIFMGEITGLTTEGDYRMHAISRDHTEEYLVVYGEGDLKVFEIYDDNTMVEATVNVDADAQTYIDNNSPNANQLRLVTVADFTIIVNTTVTAAAGESDSFTYDKTHKSFDRMLSHTPADDAYHEIDSEEAGFDPEYWQYDASDGTFATYQMKEATGNDAKATGIYDESGNNPGGFKVGFKRFDLALTGVTYTHSSTTLTKTGAFAGITWAEGDAIYVDGGTNIVVGWYEVDHDNGSNDDDNVVLLSAAGTTDNADTTTDGRGYEYEVTIDLTDHNLTDMEEIASEFQDALRNAGARDALIGWTPTGGNSGYMTITSPYRGSEAAITAPTSPTAGHDYSGSNQAFDPDFGAAGTGSPTDDTLAPVDRWTEVPKPAAENAVLTATTMPVQMVRTSYTGDGSTPAVFDVDPVDWTKRFGGTNDTNPAPSFVGQEISDISFHRNRLVFGSGENIVFSQAGDFFNFYIDDPDNIVDADPIDVALSSEEVTLIDFLVPFRKSLLMFTKAGRQFELNAPEALTPTTAAITPTTAYKSLSIRPQPLGNLVYFVAARKDAAVVYEYYYDESRASNIAANVTRHTPTLLPSDIRSLSTSTNNEMLVVLPLDCDKLYSYQFYFDGNEKKQSAWGKWQYHDDYRIADIEIIRNDLYMLVEMDGQFMIERTAITRQVIS